MTTFAPSQQIELFGILGSCPTSLSEARHAKTSVRQTRKAKGSMVRGQGSSSKPSDSSENADLVGSLLRTALISELVAQTGFSAHWKKSTTPAGRLWSVLMTLEQTTNVKDHGLLDVTSTKLPTPLAGNSGTNRGGGGGRNRKQEAPRPSLSTLLRQTLPTPMASDGMQEGRGGGAGSTYPFLKILATPRKSDGERGGRGDILSQLRGYPSKHAGMLTKSLTPTATGNLTAPSMQKWAGARALAALLQSHGLIGTAALPVTYGWMMGFPPGWLTRALQQAVEKGRLQQVLLSKPSETPSSRKSRKR